MDLSWLLFLACPIGMGLMMWMMMRGNQGQQAQQGHGAPRADDVVSLRRQLQSLEEQQEAIAARMRELSAGDADGKNGAGSQRPLTKAKSMPDV